jgi:pyruvate carboxylase
VQTNIDLLIRLLEHPVFSNGDCKTTFIDSNLEILAINSQLNKGQQLLLFLGDAVVNGSRIQGQMVSPELVQRQPQHPRSSSFDFIFVS